MGEAVVWFLRLIDKVFKWLDADNRGNCYGHYTIICIIAVLGIFALVIERRQRNNG